MDNVKRLETPIDFVENFLLHTFLLTHNSNKISALKKSGGTKGCLALVDLIAGSIFAGAVQTGDVMLTTKLFAGLAAILAALVFLAIAFVRKTNKAREVAMKRLAQRTSTPSSSCKLEAEAVQLTSDDLLKRVPKEQAITLVQGILRLMEESLNVPDIPAAKARLEKVLEDLKVS